MFIWLQAWADPTGQVDPWGWDTPGDTRGWFLWEREFPIFREMLCTMCSSSIW